MQQIIHYRDEIPARAGCSYLQIAAVNKDIEAYFLTSWWSIPRSTACFFGTRFKLRKVNAFRAYIEFALLLGQIREKYICILKRGYYKREKSNQRCTYVCRKDFSFTSARACLPDVNVIILLSPLTLKSIPQQYCITNCNTVLKRLRQLGLMPISAMYSAYFNSATIFAVYY